MTSCFDELNENYCYPFIAEVDAKRGLRHSGLYEDKCVLKAFAYWMAHVK